MLAVNETGVAVSHSYSSLHPSLKLIYSFRQLIKSCAPQAVRIFIWNIIRWIQSLKFLFCSKNVEVLRKHVNETYTYGKIRDSSVFYSDPESSPINVEKSADSQPRIVDILSFFSLNECLVSFLAIG